MLSLFSKYVLIFAEKKLVRFLVEKHFLKVVSIESQININEKVFNSLVFLKENQ